MPREIAKIKHAKFITNKNKAGQYVPKTWG
jgi:hypothetical protein